MLDIGNALNIESALRKIADHIVTEFEGDADKEKICLSDLPPGLKIELITSIEFSLIGLIGEHPSVDSVTTITDAQNPTLETFEVELEIKEDC